MLPDLPQDQQRPPPPTEEGRRLMPESYPLGRIPLFDEQSRNYPARKLSAAEPTRNVWHHIPPRKFRLNQTLGSCTCAALAQMKNTTPNRRSLEPTQARGPLEAYKTIDDVEDSYRGVYHWVTIHDPFDGEWPPTDTGSSVLTAGKASVQFGWAKQYTWLFGVNEVIAGLPFGPIEIGTDWTENMFTPNRRGFIEPTGDVVGGHAYVLYGMNIAERWFGILNSWRGWGINRSQRAKISFDHADLLLRRDGEAMALVV